MVNVNTNEVVTNGLQQQSCNNRTVNTTREGKQNFLVTNLTTNKFYLVGNEILHIPVCLCIACIENKTFDSILYCILVISKLRKLNFAQSLVMTCSHNWESRIVNLWQHIDSYTIDNIVRATIDNNTLDVWQRLQFIGCNVVRIDFAVNA